MAGPRGVRHNLRHNDDCRLKIKTSQIINRLQSHIDEPCMTATQIKAAEILLRKTIPDLATMTLSNENGDALPVSIIKLICVEPEMKLIESKAIESP